MDKNQSIFLQDSHSYGVQFGVKENFTAEKKVKARQKHEFSSYRLTFQASTESTNTTMTGCFAPLLADQKTVAKTEANHIANDCMKISLSLDGKENERKLFVTRQQFPASRRK